VELLLAVTTWFRNPIGGHRYCSGKWGQDADEMLKPTQFIKFALKCKHPTGDDKPNSFPSNKNGVEIVY
jgi:hypothetical protein